MSLASASELFRPIPRRDPLVTPQDIVPVVWQPPPQLPPVAPTRAALRLLRWGAVSCVFVVRQLADRWRGTTSDARLGIHLREVFQSMGGMAVKLGQQLSVRLDVLSFETCQELTRLTDKVRPISLRDARDVIEEQLGCPLEEVFSSFDPAPIGSASMACVYQAHLLDGTHVAVKVQRPGIADGFAIDLFAIHLITRALEFMTVVRPGLFRNVRAELQSMFVEELDFTLEARYQSIFREQAKKVGYRWLTAPKLYREWCSRRVMVMAYVEGFPCAEVLSSFETRKPEAMARLAQNHISARRCAERLWMANNWMRFEFYFFHADPHPANILILPDDQICLIDFGSCGTNAYRNTACTLYMTQVSNDQEPHEMMVAATHMVMPLPLLDRRAFTHNFEHLQARNLVNWADPEANWFESTSATLWLGFLSYARDWNIPMNIDTLRAFRGSLLYDTVVARLGSSDPREPPLDWARMKDRYLERYAERSEDRRRRFTPRRPPPWVELWRTLRDAREVVKDFDQVLSRNIFVLQQTRGVLSILARQLFLLTGATIAILTLRWALLARSAHETGRGDPTRLMGVLSTPEAGLIAVLWLTLLLMRLRHPLSRLVRS